MPPPAGITGTPLDRWAWLGVRLAALAVATRILLVAFEELRIVLVPIAVALLLASVLHPVARRLAARLGRTGGAVVAVLGALALVVGVVALGSWVVADSMRDDVVPAVREVRADVERWLEDGPLEIERDELERSVREAADGLAAEGAVAGSVVTAGEVLAGALLAIVLTIFATRDLDRAVDVAARRHRQPERVRAACEEALARLRSYLRAVVTLGVVEGTIIGATVALVSSPGLGVGIGALTFVAAFFPVVGAVAAGAAAVAAVLATAGLGPALLTLAVAVAVQQLDNDLLAPYLYGRAVSLHPALVLVALTGGAALAGLAGAALAVPALSAGLGASEAWRAERPGAGADGATVEGAEEAGG